MSTTRPFFRLRGKPHALPAAECMSHAQALLGRYAALLRRIWLPAEDPPKPWRRGVFSQRGDRGYPWGLMVGFLFFILAVCPVMGQEALPALIKKMELSIVVIVTYGRDGSMLGQGSGFFVNQ